MAEAQTWATGPSPKQTIPCFRGGPVAHRESRHEANCPLGQWPRAETNPRASGTWATGPGENRTCMASHSAPVAQLRSKPDPEDEMGKWPGWKSNLHSSTLCPSRVSPEKRLPDCSNPWASGPPPEVSDWRPTHGPVAQGKNRSARVWHLGHWPRWKAALHGLATCASGPASKQAGPGAGDGPVAHRGSRLALHGGFRPWRSATHQIGSGTWASGPPPEVSDRRPTPGPVAQLEAKPAQFQPLPMPSVSGEKSPDRSHGPLAHVRQNLAAWLRYLRQWPSRNQSAWPLHLRQRRRPPVSNSGRWASGPPPGEDWVGIPSWRVRS